MPVSFQTFWDKAYVRTNINFEITIDIWDGEETLNAFVTSKNKSEIIVSYSPSFFSNGTRSFDSSRPKYNATITADADDHAYINFDTNNFDSTYKPFSNGKIQGITKSLPIGNFMGGGMRTKYANKTYTVRTGKRGGKYIVRDGKKIYV